MDPCDNVLQAFATFKFLTYCPLIRWRKFLCRAKIAPGNFFVSIPSAPVCSYPVGPHVLRIEKVLSFHQKSLDYVNNLVLYFLL